MTNHLLFKRIFDRQEENILTAWIMSALTGHFQKILAGEPGLIDVNSLLRCDA